MSLMEFMLNACCVFAGLPWNASTTETAVEILVRVWIDFRVQILGSQKKYRHPCIAQRTHILAMKPLKVIISSKIKSVHWNIKLNNYK